MSKAYKCDRCGKLYVLNDKTRIVFDGQSLNIISVGNVNCHSFNSPFDICTECAVSFNEWWKDPTIREKKRRQTMKMNDQTDFVRGDELRSKKDLFLGTNVIYYGPLGIDSPYCYVLIDEYSTPQIVFKADYEKTGRHFDIFGNEKQTEECDSKDDETEESEDTNYVVVPLEDLRKEIEAKAVCEYQLKLVAGVINSFDPSKSEDFIHLFRLIYAANMMKTD